uniref:Dihydrolipoamide acetyltransferase component of pyruvate dehydrogenase complex n=1 Tax=Panagrolaimus sp. JU765 TaxID=591449 RepID=A0AC34QQA1_9BILA
MSKIPAGTATMPLKTVYNRNTGRLIAATVALTAASSSHQFHCSSLVASFVGESKTYTKPSVLNAKQKIIKRIRNYATAAVDYPQHKKIMLPALSPTMETGTIVSWAKKEGDKLSEGDLLCEIETDKATMGFEVPEEGYLAKILLPEGTKDVKVGRLLCIVVENEADIAAFIKFEKEAPRLHVPSENLSSVAPKVVEPMDQIKATPFAKKMADEKGVNLTGVSGSGPNGEVLAADLITGTKPKSPAGKTVDSHIDLPLDSLKQAVSKQVAATKHNVPHYYLKSEVILDEIEKVRQRLNKMMSPRKLSINDFLLKAAALACRKVPEANSFFMGNEIRQNKNVDVSLTVKVENGFVNPVIRDAANLGLSSINAAVEDFKSRAKSGKLEPHELQGGSFTISSTEAAQNGQDCAAILNSPQACNLAVGKRKKKVVPDDAGIKAISTLNVTLSCDHRVVDGAVGATWLKIFKNYIEKPQLMLL